MSQQTKVVTGINTRLSYANIWEPKSINGGKEKYSVSLIIPKSDQKIRDGEPLGGHASASDDFTAIDDSNDDDFLA